MSALKMIDEFQCPGCLHGINTSDCSQFKLMSDPSGCTNHRPATFMSGAGKLALGLPKGFNRCGPIDFSLPGVTFIRLYEKIEDHHGWDKFNIAVWAMEKDGYLFVRTYLPRTNRTYVDVIKGGTLDKCPGAINVGEFSDDID